MIVPIYMLTRPCTVVRCYDTPTVRVSLALVNPQFVRADAVKYFCQKFAYSEFLLLGGVF